MEHRAMEVRMYNVIHRGFDIFFIGDVFCATNPWQTFLFVHLKSAPTRWQKLFQQARVFCFVSLLVKLGFPSLKRFGNLSEIA